MYRRTVPMNAPINPQADEFIAFAEAGKSLVVPLIFRVPNDGLLAWAAFATLENRHPYAFLLESAATGDNGRYSFMGIAPRRLFCFSDGVFSVRTGDGRVLQESPCTDPITALQQQIEGSPAPAAGGDLPPFWGGVVGYMGYDCVHYFEKVGEMKPDFLKVPDMIWMQTDLLAVFDHYRHYAYIIKSCYAEDAAGDWGACYVRGRRQATTLLEQLSASQSPALRLPPPPPPRPLQVQSNFSRDEFCRVVEAFKRHITAGDIFQGVPSQRLSFAQLAPTLDIYRCLRRMNPSPYMFYLKCGDFVAAGASPELMIWCDNQRMQLRPIAGTRPRGKNPAADAALEAELLADKKEIAEHLMLVDLGRNDAGRVAQAGSVRVSRFCTIEKYSHVMHIVSAVEGVLRPPYSSFDALRAAFPAGTLSGAPKVRAMQLINEYEPCKRNIYGGCAGYVGFDGGMTTCIAIRSFVAKDGRCHVQAGSGIVADSIPENEYQESLNKAAAVLRAAEMAAEEQGGAA